MLFHLQRRFNHPALLFQFLVHCFLCCFHGSCVDLAAISSVLNLCISCSVSIFHLLCSNFTSSLFSLSFSLIADPFLYQYFMHFLPVCCPLFLSFALHFPLFTFFFPVSWLVKKYITGNSYIQNISLKTQLHLQ